MAGLPSPKRGPFLPAVLVVAALVAAVLVLGRPGPQVAVATAEPSAAPSASAIATAVPSRAFTQAPSANATSSTEPVATAPGAITARPGVPAALANSYWYGLGFVGSVATTAYQRLADGEQVIDVAEGYIATAIAIDDGSGSKIVIRRFDTGDVVRTIDTDAWAVQGVIGGGRLFWTGMILPGVTSEPALDGGVWAFDLAGDADPLALVPPGEVAPMFGGRLPLYLSPSNQTLSATFQGVNGNRTVFIDVERLSVRASLDELVAAITDEVAIIRRNAVNMGAQSIAAMDIDTGDRLWRFPPADGPATLILVAGTFTTESHFAFDFQQVRGNDFENVFGMIDIETGRTREFVIEGPDGAVLRFQPQLSSTSMFAFSSGELGDDPAGLTVSLFDPETGLLTPAAFLIELP